MPALTVAVILQLAATPACTVPGMVPDFWTRVVRKESSYDPLAIRDDTANRSFYPSRIETAETLATQLMAAGHSVGVGLTQLTATSPQAFSERFGLTLRDALDPCANMHAGAQHFVKEALSIYNTGSPTKGMAYAARITGLVQHGLVPPSTAAPTGNRHAFDTEVWE